MDTDPLLPPRREPLWKAIARTLRAEIAVGHYLPGTKLPTEAEFAARFGVNRHTVRQGLAALAADGIVHSRRGAGVFVTTLSLEYPLGRRVRLQQNLALAGRLPGRRILALVTRPADAVEAAALGVDLVHVAEGVSLADEVPIAVFRSVFPAVRMPDLPQSLRAETSVTRALALNGVADYTRASTRITAQLATATQANLLRLREGAPLIRTEAVNVDTQGVAVEYGLTWFASDRVTLSVEPD